MPAADGHKLLESDSEEGREGGKVPSWLSFRSGYLSSLSEVSEVPLLSDSNTH